MINEKLREYLKDEGFDCIVLDSPAFDKSIVGFSTDGKLVYDLEMMIQEFVIDENVEKEIAAEYIAYNTIRALPYMGDKAPVILNRFEGVE